MSYLTVYPRPSRHAARAFPNAECCCCVAASCCCCACCSAAAFCSRSRRPRPRRRPRRRLRRGPPRGRRRPALCRTPWSPVLPPASAAGVWPDRIRSVQPPTNNRPIRRASVAPATAPLQDKCIAVRQPRRPMSLPQKASTHFGRSFRNPPAVTIIITTSPVGHYCEPKWLSCESTLRMYGPAHELNEPTGSPPSSSPRPGLSPPELQ